MPANRGMLIFTAGVLVALAACQPKSLPMTPEESQRVAKITERMSTRCVGRFVIDLPASFVLNSQSSAEVDGVKVEVQPMEKWRFDDWLEAYEGKLKRTKLPLYGRPFLQSTLPIDNGLLFDRAASEASTGRAARRLEAWGWKEGFRIHASTEAFNGTFPEDADSKYHREQGSDVPQRIQLLTGVFSRLRGRDETESPPKQGFCIPQGFVAGPPSEDERAYVAFHLENAPDVYFHVSAVPDVHKEKSRLLQRSAQVEREMEQSGTQTIRKGAVQHGGAALDEWLMKGPTPDDVSGTMFVLHGNEATPGAEHPFMRVELFNGFRIPTPERTAEESAQLKALKRASLSEAEASAIWDKVVPTLRQRPGAL